MTKILIVEDEPEMSLGLKKNLTFEGYEVETAVNGEDALPMMLKNNYHLAILDIMLPGMDGFELCRKARADGIQIPMIFLSARSQEIDKVVGLEIGADDYITKPFSLRELSARIKVVLRRYEKDKIEEKSLITVGRLVVDLKSYSATCDGKKVAMTHREIEILKYFVRRNNTTVTRDELLREIWGEDEFITRRTVDNFIYKLRKKIENRINEPQHIITVHKVGYKLID